MSKVNDSVQTPQRPIDARKWDRLTKWLAIGAPIFCIVMCLVGVLGNWQLHLPDEEWLKLGVLAVLTVLIPLTATGGSWVASKGAMTKEVRLKLAEGGVTTVVGLVFLMSASWVKKLSDAPVPGAEYHSNLATIGTGLILSLAVLKYVSAALEACLDNILDQEKNGAATSISVESGKGDSSPEEESVTR